MPTQRTRYVSFDTLRQKGGDAVVVVKLMMACSDISFADQALYDWRKPQPRMHADRQVAAGRYFIRIQLSHLYEAMKIIKQIDRTPTLRAIVDQCDGRTRGSFQKLLDHAHGGTQHARFKKLVGQLRHNLTFHYDQCDALLTKAISDRADSDQISSLSRASTSNLWRFAVADDVLDSVVVRGIWGIPRNADLRLEADKIAVEVHDILLAFTDFAGEFIFKALD